MPHTIHGIVAVIFITAAIGRTIAVVVGRVIEDGRTHPIAVIVIRGEEAPVGLNFVVASLRDGMTGILVFIEACLICAVAKGDSRQGMTGPVLVRGGGNAGQHVIASTIATGATLWIITGGERGILIGKGVGVIQVRSGAIITHVGFHRREGEDALGQWIIQAARFGFGIITALGGRDRRATAFLVGAVSRDPLDAIGTIGGWPLIEKIYGASPVGIGAVDDLLEGGILNGEVSVAIGMGDLFVGESDTAIGIAVIGRDHFIQVKAIVGAIVVGIGIVLQTVGSAAELVIRPAGIPDVEAVLAIWSARDHLDLEIREMLSR